MYAHMKVKRAHILLPDDLLREIDALVGPRGRSAFLVETARQEVRRQKLLQFLEGRNSAWKNKDHPELAEGAVAWVNKLRTESEARSARLYKPKKQARSQTPRTH
jgi:metal-responsive CopG/Arc/MetJ family transcriptional regulator